MILTNTETIHGTEILNTYGIVYGSTIRTKNVFVDIGAHIKNMFGGELRGYTQLLEESRSEATERMIRLAEEKGANAIINIRFSTSTIAMNAAEIYVYGTAVKISGNYVNQAPLNTSRNTPLI